MPTLRHARRLLLAALLPALVLSIVASSATATRLSFSERGFRVAWNPVRVTFAGFTATNCNVTLEGSLHTASIAKVARALLGYVTRASVSSCNSEASVTVLSESLPWHVQYASFAGTLPNISSVRLRLVGASLRGSFSGGSCLARTEENRPAIFNVNRNEAGVITSVSWEERTTIPVTGGGFCSPVSGLGLQATSTSVTGLGNTRAITLTLI